MSVEVKFLDDARQQYEDLRQASIRATAARERSGIKKAAKAEGLFRQAVKCIAQLSNNPRHPGLQTHEYHSMPHPYRRGEKVFEAYVQNRTPGAYRVFWCYGPGKNHITIIAITPHP